MESAIQQTALDVQATLAGKQVFLTGATGFLAKVVLEKLIRAVPDIGGITLLIRAGRDDTGARARFQLEIATSSVFDKLRAERPHFLETFFAEKIHCITGEITEPAFGLPLARFAELARNTDLIINAAASVNFREALDEALAINAHSVQNVAALARTANAPLVQVSTCYVNGFNKGEMREEMVHPARAAIARHRHGHYDLSGLLAHLQRRIGQVRKSVSEPAELARRLTAIGIEEANYFGWNDTYTFTKWMGEQLAAEAMHGRALSIVRPSIIESTLQEPAAGWIEGVKVADAIILAYARGKTSFFPAKPEEIVDIIPADLVANSIVLAGVEALNDAPAHRIYQACSGSGNPVRLGKVIELIQNESRRNWRNYERLFFKAPRHRFRVVGRPTFLLMLRAMAAGLALRSGLRQLLGLGESPALEALRTTQTLAQTFSFYTAPQYRFHNDGLLALAQRFSAQDGLDFPVDPRLIDWRDYLCRIHMGGLNRYALRARPAGQRPPPGEKHAMTRRDYAWHRMDTEKNLMVINSILLFEGPVDMQRLTATIAYRLPNYPRFTQKVKRRLGLPQWVEDEHFDIRQHIRLESTEKEVGLAELQSRMTELAHQPLEEDRPLWHMTVIDQAGGGHAIVFRVHHCITDGLGLVHVLNHLTDDNGLHGQTPSLAGHPHRALEAEGAYAPTLTRARSSLKIAAHIGRLGMLWPDLRTRLKAPLSGQKQLVWLPPLDLQKVRIASKRMGATLNDIWVAAVSGALRQYLQERGQDADSRALRAAVTFNLREKANAFQLGNEFGLVAVDLPTDLDDPCERLRRSSARMTAIKRSHQPRATMAFLSLAGCLPTALQHFALNLFTSKGSVVLTNIEGPGSRRYLAGSRMTDLICWVPQAGRIGVGLAFISYAGQIQLALFVDTHLVPDPERLMELTRQAFAELELATRDAVDEAESIATPLAPAA
ncbi:wax ester/triacylglycerol synthase family O-acyltransferase [Massilia sp. BJB1822]|uniref:wax ester/triacylglycerol synthase family O-acyltransferase n=1 Tax=Massilia sp. BJB1822 TaxID=2744470 RepID=UPI001E5AC74B|nr:wax ester/triacylglycerol synthase family O-acyltransferase [Massilia sp. BJB1822]